MYSHVVKNLFTGPFISKWKVRANNPPPPKKKKIHDFAVICYYRYETAMFELRDIEFLRQGLKMSAVKKYCLISLKVALNPLFRIF